MENQITEIAQRIHAMRDILEISPEAMAARLGVSVEDYIEYESGRRDFSFTFLYGCAKIFGIDIVELITGETPKLSFYTIVRHDCGLPIKRREGFTYNHLAYSFKHKKAEPFLVKAPFRAEEQNEPIALSHHKGQEFDYIISGSLKVAMEDHIEILHAGDSIYYDSGHGHGMIATGGEECVFLALVFGEKEEKKNEFDKSL